MRVRSPVNPEKLYTPALLLIFLVGIAFRIYPVLTVGFKVPFDLGGLFYQMSLEIIRNGFSLPVSIPFYYPGGLPFAYPPLPFYLQAVLIKLFSPPDFITVNLLPPLLSILSLFAFLPLAKKVVQNKGITLAATFTFAILPLAVTEQVEAMGLAESMGTLALILYTYALLWARDSKRRSAWLFPGLMLGFCALSSPGSLYASLLISLLFFAFVLYGIFKHRDWSFLLAAALVAFTGLVVSSPWWLTVISHHGIAIFLNAFFGQNSDLLSQFWTNLHAFRLIWASLFWNILFLVCLVGVVVRKQFALLLYTLLLLVIIRERWIMSIPVSLVIGIGIGFITQLLAKISTVRVSLVQVAVVWSLILFFVYDSAHELLGVVNAEPYDITLEQVSELYEIKRSTLIPVSAEVVVVGNWGLIEWSPALLERTVIDNPYGLEWMPERVQPVETLAAGLGIADTPARVMASVQQAFPGLRSFYLVASRIYIDRLGQSADASTVEVTILQEYQDLSLGIVTLNH